MAQILKNRIPAANSHDLSLSSKSIRPILAVRGGTLGAQLTL
jgi:hypothetical protein